jgi:predicted MFS family arabinose efflux permease
MLASDLTPQSRFLLKASLAGAFAEAMLLPVFAIFTEQVGGSVLDAGIGFGIFEIVSGLFVILVGSTDWFQRNVRPIVFAGFLLSGLAEFSYILVRSRWQLFAVQAAVGIAIGMMNPAWDSLYAEDAHEGDSARNWSVWSGGVNLSQGIAALLGGLIVTRLGFHSLFVMMAVVNCFSVFFAAKVLFLKRTRPSLAAVVVPISAASSTAE